MARALHQPQPHLRPPGGSIEELVSSGLLHPKCWRIFRRNKTPSDPVGADLLLHRHQREAVEAARRGESYVLTTGTGSDKSLAYLVPIVDRVLRDGPGRGIRAIVIYPMNALANSQTEESSSPSPTLPALFDLLIR